MFGPTNDPFPLTSNSFAGSLGARKDDSDDDIDHGPNPPPIWKQIATVVALSGLVAAVETFARRAVHRLFDGPEGSKTDSSQPMIMMLAPDSETDLEDKEEGKGD